MIIGYIMRYKRKTDSGRNKKNFPLDNNNSNFARKCQDCNEFKS